MTAEVIEYSRDYFGVELSDYDGVQSVHKCTEKSTAKELAATMASCCTDVNLSEWMLLVRGVDGLHYE
jgi:hypothetical protein